MSATDESGKRIADRILYCVCVGRERTADSGQHFFREEMNLLKQIFPLLDDLSTYSTQFFKKDIVAGLTVGILLIPQGMAYAFLAGLPPVYGLYAGLVPLLIYGLMGSSRHLSVGPVAISSLLVLAGISELAEPFSEQYIELALIAAFYIGIFQLMMGVLQMGFLVNFLSLPVISGFTSAAAIIILLSQLKDVFGIQVPRFEYAYENGVYLVNHLNEIHWLTVGIGIGAIVLILLIKKINDSIPDKLVLVVIAILVTYYGDLTSKGLAIIGAVPEGLPSLSIPVFDLKTFKQLLPTVVTVTIIGVVESIGIAKSIEAKHQTYHVRPNHELFAIGISKIAGAFFQAFPTSASYSRSAVNDDAGAKTGVSSILSAVMVLLTLLFFTQLFYYLPKAILAAIIIVAIRNLFNYKQAIYLWKTHRVDFWMLLATFSMTLVFGIVNGVLVGVVLSVLTVLYRSSRPHVAVLGKLKGTNYYKNIQRFEDAEQAVDTLIVRFDDQLYFGNAAFFKETIINLINEKDSRVRHLFLDAKGIHAVDSTGLQTLREVNTLLRKRKIILYVCGAIGPVRDLLERSGMMEEIGRNHCFLFLQEGMEQYRK